MTSASTAPVSRAATAARPMWCRRAATNDELAARQTPIGPAPAPKKSVVGRSPWTTSLGVARLVIGGAKSGQGWTRCAGTACRSRISGRNGAQKFAGRFGGAIARSPIAGVHPLAETVKLRTSGGRRWLRLHRMRDHLAHHGGQRALG